MWCRTRVVLTCGDIDFEYTYNTEGRDRENNHRFTIFLYPDKIPKLSEITAEYVHHLQSRIRRKRLFFPVWSNLITIQLYESRVVTTFFVVVFSWQAEKNVGQRHAIRWKLCHTWPGSLLPRELVNKGFHKVCKTGATHFLQSLDSKSQRESSQETKI